jgi:hypothetical protein
MKTEELLERLHGDCPVKVIHGANDGLFNIAGTTVATLWASLSDVFNIPADALAFVNGEQVDPSFRLLASNTVEFVKQYGEKSILDPEEKAQLDRIESLLNRLFVKPADHGSRGRSVETLEIATFINQLRKQGLTWKEVLKACRERWPDDAHVRNVDQVRATYRRFFRPSRKRSD